MKTIRQWLKEGLSKEDYERAEKYAHEDWVEKAKSFKDALAGAFAWASTQERDVYWRKIRDNGGSLQTDPMRVTEQTISNQTPGVLPNGLTKREYFAGLAMQGLLANGIPGSHNMAQNLIPEALYMADELLKQLENENN